MTREMLIEVGLPVADKCILAFAQLEGYEPRVAVIGPTREELDRFAPNLSQGIRRTSRDPVETRWIIFL